MRLIQFLHDGMKVEVSVDGAITPVIDENNGLRQPIFQPCERRVEKLMPAFWN